MDKNNPLTPNDIMPNPSFSERHTRKVTVPIETVWTAATELRGSEIRLLAPLLNLRELPSKLNRKSASLNLADQTKTFIEEFAAQGAIVLRQDTQPINGKATLLFGAAGKFWKPVGNKPIHFDNPEEFCSFDTPDYARFIASIEAVEKDDHVELITETRIQGNDKRSNMLFAFYWALIRLPSGLIRRSWLAAIERRALQPLPAPVG